MEFEDAQALARQYPETFEAPSHKELSKLGPGDRVKVCRSNERFWCTIEEMDGERVFATVEYDLLDDHPFELGDLIEFEKRNIFDIWEE
jgi:hypothetical protein